ncbi:hypothetical protein Tco_0115164 [Tanacetum coccineum]
MIPKENLHVASFVASFRRNPRGGVEEEQLHHLVELVVGSILYLHSTDRCMASWSLWSDIGESASGPLTEPTTAGVQWFSFS